MYHVIKSRAGRYGLVLTIARQLNALQKPVTSYSIAKALDCSPPTARKLLRTMCDIGILSSTFTPYRNTTREIFSVLDDVMTEEQHAMNSQAMATYWSVKNVS